MQNETRERIALALVLAAVMLLVLVMMLNAPLAAASGDLQNTPYPSPTPLVTEPLTRELPDPPPPGVPIEIPEMAIPTAAPLPTLQPIQPLTLPEFPELRPPELPNTLPLEFLPELNPERIPTTTDSLTNTDILTDLDVISMQIGEVYSGLTDAFISRTLEMSETVLSRLEEKNRPEKIEIRGSTAVSISGDMSQGMMVVMDYARAISDFAVIGPIVIALLIGFGWMIIVNLAHFIIKVIIIIIDFIIFVVRLITELVPGL